ncbi:MAG: diaminopropionate ammonia-lyase [Clostridia bacterium]
MKAIQWKYNERAREACPKSDVSAFGPHAISKIRAFHQSFAAYSVTPLRCLEQLSAHLGLAGIYVKDESYRFGLNAFKVLGGAYAIGNYLAQRLGMDISELSFERLQTPEMKERLGEITFTTATDGNHGRGVAWAAQQLGQKAVIYMPKGSSQIRLDNILATGAEGYITDLNYDDAVRLSAENAQKYGWVVIQDTAWEGYEDIPEWIMQGYATMGVEALEQLGQLGCDKPTHIFLQAGVGSYAGAIQALLAAAYGEDRPITVVVEPDKADCLYRSAVIDDGMPYSVGGDLDTIMAGLACGEPNQNAWAILRDYTDAFVSVPDVVAARGMRILGNPLGTDERVISGESGAVTVGLLSLLMKQPELADLRQKLGLNAESRVVCFNTEGDTDPEHYRKIVWDGAYPNE